MMRLFSYPSFVFALLIAGFFLLSHQVLYSFRMLKRTVNYLIALLFFNFLHLWSLFVNVCLIFQIDLHILFGACLQDQLPRLQINFKYAIWNSNLCYYHSTTPHPHYQLDFCTNPKYTRILPTPILYENESSPFIKYD